MCPEGNQLILLPEAHGELTAKVYANVNVSGGFAAHRMCRHGDAGLSSQILVVRVCSDPMSRKKERVGRGFPCRPHTSLASICSASHVETATELDDGTSTRRTRHST